MKEVLKKIYSSISFLGLLPKKMGQALLSFFLKIPSRIVKGLRSFFKETFASKKLLVHRGIVAVAIIVVIISLSILATTNIHKVSAIALSYNGQTIGYAASEDDAELARANACVYIKPSVTKEIVYEQVKTDAHMISDPESLCDIIVDTLKEDLVEVSEVFVGNKFICAVDDPIGARDAFSRALENARLLYPDQAVSFASSLSLTPTYYKKGDKITSIADLEAKLSDPQILQIQHAQCLEAIAYTEFETVEIQTAELFVGDTRVKRTGQSGTEYQVSLVKTVNGNEISSEHLMSVPVKEAVTQIVERGIRAENLIMDTYTVVQTLGVFCWPCVDLFEVTSDFGDRELNSEQDYHHGIDISGPYAEGCLVVAAAGGTVTEAGYNSGGYGNYVIIDHGNGIETLYAHMLDNSLRVRAGDKIEKGEVIGQVGNTGFSFGAHLHFEVRISGVKVNPAPYLGLQS